MFSGRMKALLRYWKDISIAKKLYAVFGVMAFLVVMELVVLSFMLNTLSSVRAFVAGEGSWSKAQKNAALSLQRYLNTRDPQDFELFLEYLKVPEGDRRARLELAKPNPDMSVVKEGFIAGHIHPDDIEGMVRLLDRFQNLSYLQRSMSAWAEGDSILEKYKVEAEELYQLLQSPNPSPQDIREKIRIIKAMNARLTDLEDEFSSALGEGARWVEGVVVFLLFLAVISVEGVGLTLTFLTSRGIKTGLGRLAEVADGIGRGDFSQRAEIHSGDEIGHLAGAVNRMGSILQKSYAELESRVAERTAELEQAVKARDDFLSIASHELKTPLTSLKLQVQMRRRALAKGQTYDQASLMKMVEADHSQINRITHLIDDMLDISRINQGRFLLQKEEFDLAVLVEEVLERFAPHFREHEIELRKEIERPLVGKWDFFRVEQAFTNLVTNAIRYGQGKPIHVRLRREGDLARIEVTDQGHGIDPADQERVFRQFERAVPKTHVAGLGLGLFIVQEITQAHGGRVELESAVGKGAKFSIVLPL